LLPSFRDGACLKFLPGAKIVFSFLQFMYWAHLHCL